jgi:hypothetical protein
MSQDVGKLRCQIAQVPLSEGIYLETANTQIFKTIFMPSFVFTTIMFLIGVPGNALVFYIYFAKWRKTTGRIFILALTAFGNAGQANTTDIIKAINTTTLACFVRSCGRNGIHIRM